MMRQRLEKLYESIAAACNRAGRLPDELTLVAVTKGIGAEKINEALQLGIRDIGENRVQEYLGKISVLHPHAFHMVGHLQTNKVRHIIDHVDLLHSLDSPRLAYELEKQAGARRGRKIDVLIEVNTSGEESKFGISSNDLSGLVSLVLNLEHLALRGLMTVAAFETDPRKVRSSFRLLERLKASIETEFQMSFPCLSMGMSNDFDIAIEEGATHIRIGTAIFGPRSG